MNIGIDIDDTVTEAHKSRLILIKKYLKDNKLPFKIVNAKDSNTLRIVGWAPEDSKQFWRSVGNTFLETVKAKKDAVRVIQRLKNAGNRIVFITARDDVCHIDAYKLSECWLQKNGFIYDKLLVNCIQKTDAIINEKIDIMIDDSLGVMNETLKTKAKSFLMTNTLNKTIKIPNEVTRVNNWKDVEKLLLK